MRSDPDQRETAKSNTACGCLFCITGKECLVAMRVQTQYPQIHAVAVRKEVDREFYEAASLYFK